MNQVDSSFDDDKDDDKKPKEWFQDWVNKFKIKFHFKFHEKKSRRFKNQEKFYFKIQGKMNSRFKSRNQEVFNSCAAPWPSSSNQGDIFMDHMHLWTYFGNTEEMDLCYMLILYFLDYILFFIAIMVFTLWFFKDGMTRGPWSYDLFK